jgi:arylsulfatase A-like enzyme
MAWRGVCRRTFFSVALAASLACAAPESPPNVILVVIDNLRADRLGAYGHGRPTSPVFDALASRGELFERVQASSSWTKPSVASLFSSLEPEVHGAVSFGRPLRDDVVTLADVFAAAGYATVGVSGNFVHVNDDTGLARGFASFRTLAPLADAREDDVLLTAQDPAGDDVRLRAPRGGELNEAVLELLPEPGAAPLFLYVHYMEPHAGFDPPADVLDAVLGGAERPARLTDVRRLCVNLSR